MAGAADKCAMTTVEEIFEDFKGRRAGLLKALTTDVREFYQWCDPEEEYLALFGLPSGRWEVRSVAEEACPDLPEPTWGINKNRDRMQEHNWVSYVAQHSDAWLHFMAFYLCSRLGPANKRRLFEMINALPTIPEVVIGAASKQAGLSGNKSKIGSKAGSEPQGYCSKPMQARDGENHGLEEESTSRPL